MIDCSPDPLGEGQAVIALICRRKGLGCTQGSAFFPGRSAGSQGAAGEAEHPSLEQHSFLWVTSPRDGREDGLKDFKSLPAPSDYFCAIVI